MFFYAIFSVTLQCTKDGQIIIVVARDATLPNIDLDSVSFLGDGPMCNPVGTTSAFAIYQFSVTSCGTVMMVRAGSDLTLKLDIYYFLYGNNEDLNTTNVLQEEPGVIIYENRMSSSYEVALGPLGAITRDSQYEYVLLNSK